MRNLNKKKEEKPDAYQIVTDKLLEIMGQGEIPWRKTWQSIYEGGYPQNWSSKKFYNGTNFTLLMGASYGCNKWVTFKQAKALGGSVMKGQKSWPVVFWRFLDKMKDGKPVLDAKGNVETVPMLKVHRVFNLEQCDGIEIPKNEGFTPSSFTPIQNCERIVAGLRERPRLRLEGARAFYSVGLDEVTVPPPSSFGRAEEYYSTLFHELMHWTGHQSRLNRPFGATKKTDGYAKEELVAEIGSAFLCGEAGIEPVTIENSAAYLQTWISRLKNDKRLFVTAAGKSAKAVDWILNRDADKEQKAAA